MADFPKSIKKEFTRLMWLANDRETEVELNKLEEQFRLWRDGKIPPGILSDLIHAWHEGPNRELWKKYSLAGSKVHSWLVANAFLDGVLNDKDISENVRESFLPYLEKAIDAQKALFGIDESDEVEEVEVNEELSKKWGFPIANDWTAAVYRRWNS
ncbi:hypothetical protein K8I28_17635 [bacterium]|nr:hypothetical protein [bacterium]